jgi:cytidylate kinase
LRISVAIDGPAGAGKSTIAKLLGKRFNLMYINTGSMYRAVTLKALENNISSDNIEALLKIIDSLEMHFDNDDLIVNGENISDKICVPYISNNVSNYAAVPEVRERLVELQRKIADKYNVVMDGRDIGTVVLKNAPFKFYLTASAEERAKRRCDEFQTKGLSIDYKQVLDDIIKRDYIDSHRETNPLCKAEDAVEIDSSKLSIEEVVAVMSDYIEEKLKEGGEGFN